MTDVYDYIMNNKAYEEQYTNAIILDDELVLNDETYAVIDQFCIHQAQRGA